MTSEAETIIHLREERDTWKRAAATVGICMSCATGSQSPCTDCLGSGWAGGRNPFVLAEDAERRAKAAEEKIDNAIQACAETQPSWGWRIARVLAAIGTDFGGPEIIDKAIRTDIIPSLGVSGGQDVDSLEAALAAERHRTQILMEIGDRHLAVSFDEAAPMTKRDLRLLRAAIAHIRVERRREGTESIACECESLLGGDGCAPTSRPGPTT